MKADVADMEKEIRESRSKTMDVSEDVEMAQGSSDDAVNRVDGASEDAKGADNSIQGKDEGSVVEDKNEELKESDNIVGLKNEGIMSGGRKKKITKKSLRGKKTVRKNSNTENENSDGINSHGNKGEAKEDEPNKVKVDANRKGTMNGDEKHECQQNIEGKERENKTFDLTKDVKEGDDKVELVKIERKNEGIKDYGGNKKVVRKLVRVEGIQRTPGKNEKPAAETHDKGEPTFKEGDSKEVVGACEKKEDVKVDKNKKEASNADLKLEDQKTGKTNKRKNKVGDSSDLPEAKRSKKKIQGKTSNVEVPVSDVGDAGQSSRSGRKECRGLIFLCNTETISDCFKYNVLGLPSTKMGMVGKIYKGMRLFLFDFSHRTMYGIYKASGRGGYNIEPKAFKSAFPAQVRFKVLYDCQPLPERKFEVAIKENYIGNSKFNIELTGEQVKKLCKLFQSNSIHDKTNKWSEHTCQSASSPPKGRRKRTAMGEDWNLPEPGRDRQPTSSRIREAHIEGSSKFSGRQRGVKLIIHNGLRREREPIRAARGFRRDDAVISGVREIQREPFPTRDIRGVQREGVLITGVTMRDSDIYDREVNSLRPPPVPSYVHEDSLGVVPRNREIPSSYVQENSSHRDFPHREPKLYIPEDLRHTDLHHRELPLTYVHKDSICAGLRQRVPSPTYVHEGYIHADHGRIEPPPSYMYEGVHVDLHHREPPPSYMHGGVHVDLRHREPRPSYMHEDLPMDLRHREPPPSYMHQDMHVDLHHREPPPTYVHGGHRAELRCKELELISRERRIMDLEHKHARQQAMVHDREPRVHTDPVASFDRALLHASEYTSTVRRY